ncbi:MAG TPA: four helix bundle protein [Mariniphaga sp.]|nr:four helix bundle protein [Mariniphaga sp.]
MKNSKEYKNWKNDLNLISQLYDIDPILVKEERINVFTQLMQATTALSKNLDNRIGQEAGESLADFVKTSGESLFELYNLLRLILKMNMISIDEYHSLTNSLNEIGEIIENFLIQNNLIQEQPANNQGMSKISEIAFWTLN